MTEHLTLTGKPQVELHLLQRPADKSMYYELNVRGVAKPNTIMQGILEYGKNTNEHHAIMVLAGALAEDICMRLGDNMLDPDKVAHAAGQAYQELHAENPHIKLGNELPRDADRSLSEGRVVLN